MSAERKSKLMRVVRGRYCTMLVMHYELGMVSRTSRTARRAQALDLAIAYLGAQHAHRIRLKHVINEHIARVLEATDDNLSAAAKLLGMHRRSLQRMLRRTKKRRAR
ncbi:MAG: hypothetical protein JWM53_3591 [bacterium]|nr:hypothetical protein [bacterium]